MPYRRLPYPYVTAVTLVGAALGALAGTLVTEMHVMKHPYRAGLKARQGIEY